MNQPTYSLSYFPYSMLLYYRFLVPLVSSFYVFWLTSHINISVDDVHCELTRFRNNKLIGPDGIPANFLYDLRNYYTFPYIYLLFQTSLSEEIFPSILKFGSLNPILMGCDPTNVSNYRPITILYHIAILFETLMLINIKPAINNILIDKQTQIQTRKINYHVL